MMDFLRKIRISAAHGENNFTMERGSFRYDQVISGKKDLLPVETVDRDNGFDLLFEANDQIFIFSVEKAERGRLRRLCGQP